LLLGGSHASKSGWLAAPIKDGVIPLFPDKSGSKHKDFHEERDFTILPSIMHHSMEVQIEFPAEANLPLAFNTKRVEE
jgi:hypothetical protein